MKAKQKLISWLIVFALLGTYAVVPVNAAKKMNVKKVTISCSLTGSQKNMTVAKDKSVNVKSAVTVTPNVKANKAVAYKSANQKIATVSAKGVVKGKQAGTTKVTVVSKKNKKKKASIKVKVVKGVVTSVKLNKKQLSLKTGQKTTLKTTVKATKGAYKTVVYQSSSKVAKVSKKGVVTAVKAGTAVITAKAADGSGKKASVKVTVSKDGDATQTTEEKKEASQTTENPANVVHIAGMEVESENTVVFSLDQALALTKNQITLQKKYLRAGTYNKTLTIADLSTTDNINYRIMCEENIRIEDYVKLTISALPEGNNFIEKKYMNHKSVVPYTDVSCWTVGTEKKETVYTKIGKDEMTGYVVGELTGLPEGLSYTKKPYFWDDRLPTFEVSGTPTKAGKYEVTMNLTDEAGATVQNKYYLIVGSKDVMVGASEEAYVVTNAYTRQVSFPIVGGSGTYNTEIISDPTGKASLSSTMEIKVPSTTLPGEYTIVVKATDKNNSSLSCEIPIKAHVVQGYKLGGVISDDKGVPYAGYHKGNITITITNQDASNPYFAENGTICNDDGEYNIVVPQGTYDISIEVEPTQNSCAPEAHDIKVLRDIKVEGDVTDANVTLGLRKVKLKSNFGLYSTIVKWYIDKKYAGIGYEIYIRSGNYTIVSEDGLYDVNSSTGNWFAGETRQVTYYKVSGQMTPELSTIDLQKETQNTGVLNFPAAKDTTYTIGVGENIVTSAAKPYYAFRFTPTLDGNYKPYVSEIKIYDMTGKIVSNTDGIYSLKKGTEYIVGTGDYTGSIGYNARIDKQ